MKQDSILGLGLSEELTDFDMSRYSFDLRDLIARRLLETGKHLDDLTIGDYRYIKRKALCDLYKSGGNVLA